MLDWIKLFYLKHLEQYYKMHEIDQMDVLRYLDLINYKVEQEEIEQAQELDDAGL